MGEWNENQIFDVRFFIAWIVLFFLWHLGAMNLNVRVIDYSSLLSIFRTPEAEMKLGWVEMLADVILPGAFAWLYARGVDARPWFVQGVLFGLAAALVGVVPMFMRYSVVLPQAPSVLVEQLVYFSILMVILGAAAAFVYRNTRRAV